MAEEPSKRTVKTGPPPPIGNAHPPETGRDTAASGLPSHDMNGDGPINRDRLADTDRLGASTRLTMADASMATDLINSTTISGSPLGLQAPDAG